MSVLSLPIELPFCFRRDLAEGLQQQMFFWGQDVMRPEGNFLRAQGFSRFPSEGLKGTSCYRLPWQGGKIELYGACAGWYGPEGGFTFIRPRRRCYLWEAGNCSPVPGQVVKEFLKSPNPAALYEAALPFLDWLIQYEEAVVRKFGDAYRWQNYRAYQKVPKAKRWVEPKVALRWFQGLRVNPGGLPRPRRMK